MFVHPPQPDQPDLEIILPTAPGGGWPSATAHFDTAGTSLIIQYPTRETLTRDWWFNHLPDFAVPISLLLAIIFVWRLSRILRSPQSQNRIYCRRCNYDLTPEQFTETPPTNPCPECGTSSTESPPKRGRSTPIRLIPLLGISLPIFLFAIAVLQSSFEAKDPGNQAWPHSSFDQIRWWPLARPSIPVRQCRRFDTWSLPGGEKSASTLIPIDPIEGGLTSDLKYFAYAEFNQENLWSNRAVFFEPTTGKSRSYTMGDAGTGFCKFHGFTPDEKEAVYTNVSLVTPDGSCKARILCIALDTLAVREVATVLVTPQTLTPGNWQLPSLAAAVSISPPQWAFMPISGPQTGLLDSGTPGQAAPARQQLLTVPAGSSIATNSTLSYTQSGTLLLNSFFEVDVTTGTMRPAPNTPVVLADSFSQGQYAAQASGPVWLDSAYALTLQKRVSPDTRWYGVLVTVNNPTPQPPTYKYLVFDLTKLKSKRP